MRHNEVKCKTIPAEDATDRSPRRMVKLTSLLANEINIFNYFFFGLFLISFGVLGFNSGEAGVKNSFDILGLAFLVLGCSRLVSGLLARLSDKSNDKQIVFLQHSLIDIVAGVIIFKMEKLDILLFSVFCALFFSFIGFTKLVSYFLFKHSQVKYNFFNLILAIVYGVIGIAILVNPGTHIDEMVKLISVWFIVYGVSYWSFCLIEVTPRNKRNSMKRKIRLPLPIFIAALLPDIARQNINKLVEADPDEFVEAGLNAKKTSDIEVLVHVGPNGFNRIGHVDLFYKDRIISYGNYDEDSRGLYDMIGDGVLFFASKPEYIDLATRESAKTLVGFGLSLTPEQILAIDQRLEEIECQLISWKPDGRKKTRYSTKLKDQAGAIFYKFKASKFKKYFVFTTNCVLLADQLVGSSGLDIIKINGIITPGSYYDCLNREFRARDGIVVSRNIYR